MLGADAANNAVAGRMTLRKVILVVGGLLFVYITLTTIFGPGPEHQRKAPIQLRPESDPYGDSVPKVDNRNGIYNSKNHDQKEQQPEPINLTPIEEEENKPAYGSGQRKEEEEKSKVEAPTIDDEGDASLEADSEETVTEETPLEKVTKAWLASPATYPELLSANRRERDYAVALIVKEADLAMKSTKVYSVTNKDQTAPSKDIHDYLSLSKYYWPNKASENELPYIRRDGYVNPEIETVEDYRLLRTMIREVHMMGMAYHFTGDSSYAKKCAYRLREWFLDEATYMKPNINYGSLQKGKKLGVRTGVLDMFTIFR